MHVISWTDTETSTDSEKASLDLPFRCGQPAVTRAAGLHGIHCPHIQIFNAEDKVEGPLGPHQANDGSQR